MIQASQSSIETMMDIKLQQNSYSAAVMRSQNETSHLVKHNVTEPKTVGASGATQTVPPSLVSVSAAPGSVQNSAQKTTEDGGGHGRGSNTWQTQMSPW